MESLLALKAELERKKNEPQKKHPLQLSKSFESRKFADLKEKAKAAYIPKESECVEDDPIDDEGEEWLRKAQAAQLEKQKKYNALMAAAENDLLTSSSDEEENEQVDDDGYTDYLRQLKRYKKEENKSGLLVDFSRKIMEKYEKQENEEQEEMKESAFVEWTDEFGRTKLVTALEYGELTRKNRESSYSDVDDVPHSEIKDVHYDPDWEIRTKGVGYFRFSQDSEERSRQMNELKVLDQQVNEERERLAVAKQRKLDMLRRKM